MKAFVLTIMDLPESVQVADRCVKSAAKFGLEVEKFPAHTPQNTDIDHKLSQHKIDESGFVEKWSRTDKCKAAFFSHYTLWDYAAREDEDVLILEHDAVFVDKPPLDAHYYGLLSLGAPSYGRYNDPLNIGVNPLTSKQYLPGAHAYMLKPEAARILIAAAKQKSGPTDTFLNINRFPWLEEYYPWPVIANDSFSTIQNQNGCQAKHNFGEGYRLL